MEAPGSGRQESVRWQPRVVFPRQDLFCSRNVHCLSIPWPHRKAAYHCKRLRLLLLWCFPRFSSHYHCSYALPYRHDGFTRFARVSDSEPGFIFTNRNYAKNASCLQNSQFLYFALFLVQIIHMHCMICIGRFIPVSAGGTERALSKVCQIPLSSDIFPQAKSHICEDKYKYK